MQLGFKSQLGLRLVIGWERARADTRPCRLAPMLLMLPAGIIQAALLVVVSGYKNSCRNVRDK